MTAVELQGSGMFLVNAAKSRFSGFITPALLAAVSLMQQPTGAIAHPHVLASVEMSIVRVADDATGVDFTWTYDPGFTAFMLAEAKVPALNESVLDKIAAQQSAALAKFDFFTAVRVNGEKVGSTFSDARMKLSPNGTLTLSFQLRSQHPGAALRSAEIEIFDPNFFAYFSMPRSGAIRVDPAFGSCSHAASGPEPINLKQPRTVPKIFWAALDGSTADAKHFVNLVRLTCQ